MHMQIRSLVKEVIRSLVKPSVWSGFHLHVKKVIAYCHKNIAPRFRPIRSETKTNRDIVTGWHTFSRALRRLHVIVWSFDWFAPCLIA